MALQMDLAIKNTSALVLCNAYWKIVDYHYVNLVGGGAAEIKVNVYENKANADLDTNCLDNYSFVVPFSLEELNLVDHNCICCSYEYLLTLPQFVTATPIV